MYSAHTTGMMLFDRTSGAAGAMCDALSGTDYVAKLEAALGALYGRACVVMSSARSEERRVGKECM